MVWGSLEFKGLPALVHVASEQSIRTRVKKSVQDLLVARSSDARTASGLERDTLQGYRVGGKWRFQQQALG